MLNIKNTTDGYLKNIEIKGNTIQDINQTGDLADIRSVGDKVEGQELYKIDVVSVGKNICSGKKLYPKSINLISGELIEGINTVVDFYEVKPNTTYTTSINGVNRATNIFYYDKNKKFLHKDEVVGYHFTPPSNAKYVRHYYGINTEEGLIQTEVGTQATPYEPYQGKDKLTILSPVQLEKVGDVADRIICKDGVWGVEKNVENLVLDGSESWVLSTNADNAVRFVLSDLTNIKYSELIATIPTYMDSTNFAPSLIEFGISSRNNNSGFNFHIEKTKLNTVDLKGFKEWLKTNPVTVKYQLAEPQFIPLPQDQQIKLRTFAERTNIHFETEIEGTIKAQVPKSIGATVNTHTEQIDILNKKVFKIEEIDQVQQDMMILESDMRILDIELALMEHMPITLNLTGEGMLRSTTYFNFLKNHIINETYDKGYMENVMNKYLATNRLTQEEYDELYKLLYPQNYDIELPIEE